MSILENAEKSGNCVYSFEMFYEKYHAEVYSRALRSLRHSQDAEDVTQEVFFKAARAWEKLAHHGNLHAWVWEITNNALIDFHRCKGKGHLNHAELSEADTLIDSKLCDPYDLCDAGEFGEQVERVWQKLLPHHRHILTLSTDLRPREIAALLGYSEEQANSKVGDARTAFKRRYKKGRAA